MAQDDVFTVFEDVRRRALRIGPDEKEPKGFVFSLMPVGLPIRAADFRDPWTPNSPGLAADVEQQSQQAVYNTARLVDRKLMLDGSGREMPSATRISDTWKIIIASAEARGPALNQHPAAEERVRKAQAVLHFTNDGGQSEKTPAKAAYDDCRKVYNRALLAYSSEYNNAITTPSGKAAWPQTGKVWLSDVSAALQDWNAVGHKQEIEAAQATIEAAGQDAVNAVISEAKTAFDPWQLALQNVADTVPYAQILPSDWAEPDGADDGWVQFGYNSSHSRKHHREETTTWGGSGGVSFGFWSVGGGGGSSEHTELNEVDSSSLEITFKLGTALIDRPWLRTVLLNVRGWGLVGQEDGVISTGEGEAKADQNETLWLPAIPTEMVLIKDVRIRTADTKSLYESLVSHTSGGGSVGWGPFSIGGSYNKDVSDEKSTFDFEGGWLKIKGVQLVGWVSQLTPFSPRSS